MRTLRSPTFPGHGLACAMRTVIELSTLLSVWRHPPCYSPPTSGSAVAGVHHAENVALGVGEDHEVGAVRVLPVRPLRAEPDQPLDLGPLLGRVRYTQIEVRLIGLVQVHGRAVAVWGNERERALAARGVPQRSTPELCRPPGVRRVDNSGVYPYHRASFAGRYDTAARRAMPRDGGLTLALSRRRSWPRAGSASGGAW